MRASELFTLAVLRELKEINKGSGRIAKLLSEALAVDRKIHNNPPKHLIVIRRRPNL